ncbi:hypothetical protein MJ904_13360 [Massilia sp. MB5]|uniref:hypothetical protein n=1 Tax=unclassified Massilia TaxID=2609279 RepID=UPI00067AFD31|nr:MULTISPECIES: hypothetical protein [unclassified Massilia]AKU22183.1 hypothetical protein ACZ75_12610 [Massilia sp. NR 4-1]UMR33063.1 hypothetical protein MJ904_13360 [Massilia sp. MB5]
MSDNSNLPAISKQVTELVLAGSLSHAEQAFAEAAEQHGDLAVVEVLNNIPPHVTALHMAGFDGGKLSLATLLVPPKAWAQSLAYLAATWPDDLIEDDPERIAESLFAHIHGVVFGTEDEERRDELLQEASATDWGCTAFAILFSMAPKEVLELAGEIISKGPYITGQTTSDNDVVPLALALAKASEDGWDRALFELFPDFRHSADLADAEFSDDPDEEPSFLQRSTKELLYRLRKQVPSTRSTAAKAGSRRSMGTGIFN